MNVSAKAGMASILMAVVMLIAWTGSLAAQEQSRAPQTRTLKQRAVLAKPLRTTLHGGLRADVVVVKFREGTRIREGSNGLARSLGNAGVEDDELLSRANLGPERLAQQLAEFNRITGPGTKRFVKRLFTRPVEALDAEKQEGEVSAGEELADLNLYYHIYIQDADPRETERLIDQLNAMDIVEIAYAKPVPAPAAADIAPISPSFTANQGYMNPAPNGIDANYARTFPGGKGQGVRVIDIEGAWDFTHEDAPGLFHFSGVNFTQDTNAKHHGSAVMGVIAAAENAYGITGIASHAGFGASSVIRKECFLGICWDTNDFDDAVNRASAALSFGDVMLIEQHAPGPDSGLSAACNADQFEFIAMEFWQANFDAIKNATAKGIVVVEAAGNGGMDLDSSIYGGKFSRSVRDSGAIFVGAGSSNGRAPRCFTNFGSRVDVQAWGEDVMTLGDGDCTGCQINGTDQRQWYTDTFSGTSSASAIISGAAASLQGFRKAKSLPVLTSTGMRTFLRQTGTPQAIDSRQIGPLPNLRAAVDAHTAKRTLKVTLISARVVDELLAGPASMSFNVTFGNSVRTTPTMSYPQGASVAFPLNTVLQTEQFLNPLLNHFVTLQVTSSLPSIIRRNPSTGQITFYNRPVQFLHSFSPTQTFGSSFILGGSTTFTDRSTTLNGYFEVTYKIQQVFQFTTTSTFN